MKCNLHHLAAAIAVVLSASPSVHAASITAPAGDTISIGGLSLVLGNGSGTLTYSPGSSFDGTDPNTLGGLLGALNVGNIQVRDINGVVTQPAYIDDEVGSPVRVGLTAKAQVSGYTVDTTTGQILDVSSTGGVEHLGTRIRGTLTGGVATVTNLRFDLQQGLVYADLNGTKAAVGTNPAVNFNLLNTALWTIGNVTGPTTIDPAALTLTGQSRIDALAAAGFTFSSASAYDVFTATNVISGLKVTQAGFDFFRSSLGLLSTGVNALSAVNDDPMGWGSVTSTFQFKVPILTPAIPEPSSYAMIGVGLLVVGGTLRARRRAQ